MSQVDSINRHAEERPGVTLAGIHLTYYLLPIYLDGKTAAANGLKRRDNPHKSFYRRRAWELGRSDRAFDSWSLYAKRRPYGLHSIDRPKTTTVSALRSLSDLGVVA